MKIEQIDPFTRAPLKKEDLIPRKDLAKAIEEFKQRYYFKKKMMKEMKK